MATPRAVERPASGVRLRSWLRLLGAVRAQDGPNALVGTVEDIVGIDIDHYVEVSILSFLRIVDAAGGVRICLDEPLRDRKSGADFPECSHRMDGAEALWYVRSRTGTRANFARMERQQRFVPALADRTTSLDVLANPCVCATRRCGWRKD